jgi:hypothetical protein
VTLDEVFAAAGARAASIVPETSGYLTLALGDATSRMPITIDERTVTLTTEGTVDVGKRGRELSPKEAAEAFRSLLGRLLAVGTGAAMPSLTAAARPREESDRGVSAVVEEIEAALIPINRAAARRALARLARETMKAKESGRLAQVALPPPQPASDLTPPPAVRIASTPVAAPPCASVTPEPAVTLPSVAPTPAPEEPPAEAMEHDAFAESSVEEVAADESADAETIVRTTAVIEETLIDMTETEGDAIGSSQDDSALWTPAPHEEVRPMLTRTPLGLGPMAPVLRDPLPTIDLHVDLPIPEPTQPPAPVVHAAADEPATDEPAMDEPAMDEPAADEPSTALPADDAPYLVPSVEPEPVAVCSPPVHPEAAPTRADDLLAHFGASCIDDDRMRETAACLRRLAGLDLTPAPHVDVAKTPAPPARTPLPPSAPDERAPESPSARMTPGHAARPKSSGPSLSLTVLFVVLGALGGGALVKLYPSLFDAPPAARAAVPPPVATDPPAPPRPTTDPAAVPAPPSFVDRLGGTRAERGNGQRAR